MLQQHSESQHNCHTNEIKKIDENTFDWLKQI